jgi:hypothetical protein
MTSLTPRNGTLDHDTRDQFEARYLKWPSRREKVKFAAFSDFRRPGIGAERRRGFRRKFASGFRCEFRIERMTFSPKVDAANPWHADRRSAGRS